MAVGCREVSSIFLSEWFRFFSLIVLISTIRIDPVVSCGGSLTSFSGTIQSPGYPGNYGNNRYCQWTITVPAGYILTLTFNDFRLESCCDWVSLTGRGKFQGTNRPSVTRTQTSSFVVIFRTDGSVTYRGFKASYVISRPFSNSVLRGVYLDPCFEGPDVSVTSDDDKSTCIPIRDIVSTRTGNAMVRFDADCTNGFYIFPNIKNLTTCDVRTIQALAPLGTVDNDFYGEFSLCDFTGEIQRGNNITQCNFLCPCTSPKQVYIKFTRNLDLSPNYDSWEFCDVYE